MKRLRLALCPWVVVGLAAVACGDAADPFSAPRASPTAVGSVESEVFGATATGGKIIVSRLDSVGGDYNIFRVNAADGSGLKKLTKHPANELEPAYAPGGGRILFSSNRTGKYQIWIMFSDGTAWNRLTNSSGNDYQPAWAPDGYGWAYTSDRDGNEEIYDRAKRNLTTNPARDFYPDYSPDGTKIAFTSSRDGNLNIYVMNADGSNPTQLTSDPQDDFDPEWSPDGSRIAFVSVRSRFNNRIFVMNPDGSQQTPLTGLQFSDWNPAWSPDMSEIAVSRYIVSSGRFELWAIKADGSGQARLISNGGIVNSSPSWKP